MSKKSAILSMDDAYLHVYNRGVDKCSIFFDESYYLKFLDLLRDWSEPFNVRLPVFTLMPNHFHLLVWQRWGYAISDYLKQVCGRYARHVNLKRKRSGHLFQGRFRVTLAEDPASLLRLSWYIHQNPVRGGLSDTPEGWRFGSMREFVQPEQVQSAHRADILKLVGGQENYLRFMREYDPTLPESIYQFLV